MANLAYDSKVFTNVNKWDSQYSYRGILLSDKINQKNGQDYKLVDAIDIDWDGMWAPFASTYVYDTKDLLDVLAYIDPAERLFETNELLHTIETSYVDKADFAKVIAGMQGALQPGEHILINPTTATISTYGLISPAELQTVLSLYPTMQYLEEYAYSKQETLDVVNDKIEQLVGDANENFDTIKEIADWIMEQSEYQEVAYEDIDFSSGNRYFIFNNGKYIEVDQQYVTEHPDDTYYVLHTSMDDVMELVDKVSYIETTIGDHKVVDGEHTYSGIIGDLYTLHHQDEIINTNIDNIYNSLSNISDTIDVIQRNTNIAYSNAYNAYLMSVSAYDMAMEEIDNCRVAYQMAYDASYAVGTPYVEGHFREVTEEEIEGLRSGAIYIRTFIYNETLGRYVETIFNPGVSGVTWYTYDEPKEATGMHKAIDELEYDVRTSLFNLHVNNDDSLSYIWLSMTPGSYTDSPERTIMMHSQMPDISLEEKLIKRDGVITALTMNDVLSYMFDWEEL